LSNINDEIFYKLMALKFKFFNLLYQSFEF